MMTMAITHEGSSLEMLGRGVYSVPEAASLTGVTARKIRYWLAGDSCRPGPVHLGDYGKRSWDGQLLSFLDLIDTLVVGKLRDAGVSLQYLRKVYEPLVHELRTLHPFSRKDVFTDGKAVFIQTADEMGEKRLKEMLRQQYAMPEVLAPYLNRLEYHSESLMAARWRIAEGVLVDPMYQFGKPIVSEAGIPTAILAAAFEANSRNAQTVADWYGVTAADVQQAVQFEEGISGAAA